MRESRRHTLWVVSTTLFLALAATNAVAEPVTIYFYNNGGGSGFFIRRAWFVDGAKIVEIRSGEKVTVDLPVGRHTIRGNDTNQTYVLDVRGPMVVKYTATGFVEALIDQDPELKREYSEMTSVPPLAFATAR